MNILGLPLGVTHGWVLALLPLAALPLMRPPASAIPYSWRGLLPNDPFSLGVDRVLRTIGSLTLVSLVLAASGLHRSAYEVARVGQGAHMVLLVDRSTSMDQPFGRMTAADIAASNVQPSKGEVARELLSTFVAQRQNDRFGMVVFSTFPIPVLRPTDRHDVVHASIMCRQRRARAGRNQHRGRAWSRLSSTSRASRTPARGLWCWCRTGREKSPRPRGFGSRTGCSGCEPPCTGSTSGRSADQCSSIRPALPGALRVAEMTPELALHAFFSRMGSPYRVYTAESPEDLERAIADVSRLQNLPVRYQETIARRDFTTACLAAALAGLVLLAAARLSERSAW